MLSRGWFASCSLALALGAATVAHAQTPDNDDQAGVIKIDRIEVRPDGLRVSVDVLYPNAGLLHLVGAESSQGPAGSANSAFLEQLIEPIFEGFEDILRAEQPTASPDQSSTLGEWRPNQRVRVSSSRSRTSADGTSIDSGMDCARGMEHCQWAIGNDQLLQMLGGLDRSIETYRLSAQWSTLPGVELGLDYFDSGTLGRHSLSGSEPLVQPLLAGSDSVARGVDVSMAFGGDVGSLGQLAVSLKFRKLLDDSLSLSDSQSGNTPFLLLEQQNDAALGVNWRRGDFSGGLVSRYYDDLGRHAANQEGKTWVTFDLNFTWQTPWRGSFELGARNLIGGETAQDLSISNDEQFEHLFGRIPYLQYRQSL